MRNINHIRRAIAAAALTTSLLIPVTANAQLVVTDPAATQVLMGVAQMQAAMSRVQSSQFVKEASSEYQLVQQVQTMLKDHVDLSSITKGAGDSLLQTVSKNANLITNQTNADQNVLAAFKKLVPNFDGTMDYQKFLKQRRETQFQGYASALGVANDEASTLPQVQSEIQKIASAPASNQLQGINELVSIGKIQVNQMSSLIKVQTAMLKTMSIAYQSGSQNGFGNEALLQNSTPSQATITRCVRTNPFLAGASPGTQAMALKNCQDAVTASGS